MKTLVTVIIALRLVSCTCGEMSERKEVTERKVHVCISPNAKRYHYDIQCPGFNSCTHERREVTLSEAKTMGYTPCRME